MCITYDVMEDLFMQVGFESGKDNDKVEEWMAKCLPIESIDGVDYVIVDSNLHLISIMTKAMSDLESL